MRIEIIKDCTVVYKHLNRIKGLSLQKGDAVELPDDYIKMPATPASPVEPAKREWIGTAGDELTKMLKGKGKEPASPVANERKQGHSALVVDKETKEIKIVDLHPALPVEKSCENCKYLVDPKLRLHNQPACERPIDNKDDSCKDHNKWQPQPVGDGQVQPIGEYKMTDYTSPTRLTHILQDIDKRITALEHDKYAKLMPLLVKIVTMEVVLVRNLSILMKRGDLSFEGMEAFMVDVESELAKLKGQQ